MPDEVEALERIFQIYYGTFIGGGIRPLGELLAKLQTPKPDATPDPEDGIWRSAMRGDRAKLEALLSKGAPPTMRDELSGCTPLHICLDADTAKLLLRYGFDPNTPDCHGQTPLHYVCARLDADIAKALLDSGASPLIKDHFGRVPSDCAMTVKGDPKVKSGLLGILKTAEAEDSQAGEPDIRKPYVPKHPPRP